MIEQGGILRTIAHYRSVFEFCRLLTGPVSNGLDVVEQGHTQFEIIRDCVILDRITEANQAITRLNLEKGSQDIADVGSGTGEVARATDQKAENLRTDVSGLIDSEIDKSRGQASDLVDNRPEGKKLEEFEDRAPAVTAANDNVSTGTAANDNVSAGTAANDNVSAGTAANDNVSAGSAPPPTAKTAETVDAGAETAGETAKTADAKTADAKTGEQAVAGARQNVSGDGKPSAGDGKPTAGSGRPSEGSGTTSTSETTSSPGTSGNSGGSGGNSGGDSSAGVSA
jgi:hypothetical protein